MVIKIKIDNTSMNLSRSACLLHKFSDLLFILAERPKNFHYVFTISFKVIIIKSYIFMYNSRFCSI